MVDYHEASKRVKPKLEAVRLLEARLQDAERELYKAEQRKLGPSTFETSYQAPDSTSFLIHSLRGTKNSITRRF
jgi:hypothetical protein